MIQICQKDKQMYVTINSTIIKRTISRRKKVVETIKKNPPKEKQNWRKRVSIRLFVVDNLEGIGERGGNEVRRNL